MPAGLKAAVATAGIACETVVEAATEDALEVTMVWAWLRAAREAARRIWNCMVRGGGGSETGICFQCRFVNRCSE